ncbi:MAG: DNA adenine methylase [Chloroflexota bacterium]|nr:DNA adenine methylase [Chloroflexota bacterium]
MPHPIPYQGSKRLLAPRILALVAGHHFRRLYEPFAGSAAITIAAAHRFVADTYILADSLSPLTALWRRIIEEPVAAADEYERLWTHNLSESINHYYRIRDEFNRQHDPVQLLYLLARCVKNAPRFNQDGQFNQSPDKRRLGMRPKKMRFQVLGASALLRHRARVREGDVAVTLVDATPQDLVYMDPPYEGTSNGVDKRYHQGMDRERLIQQLEALNSRGIPWMLSYDGQCGAKRYGEYLPDYLGARRMELNAGRSSQATLNGRADTTIESLYLSPGLAGTCPPIPTSLR